MIHGMGDITASIWNTPDCSVWDAVWMSDTCQNALNTSFYNTPSIANSPFTVTPTPAVPELTQAGVGITGDYTTVAQNIADSQLVAAQQQSASFINNSLNPISDSSIPWYVWAMAGLVGLIVFEKL